MTKTKTEAHGWSCECRECLGVNYDNYHHIIARDEYAERDPQTGDFD